MFAQRQRALCSLKNANRPGEYRGFIKKCRGWDLNPPQSGEISRKIPSFSVFGLLFGLFCRFRFYFSFEVVEWTSS